MAERDEERDIHPSEEPAFEQPPAARFEVHCSTARSSARYRPSYSLVLVDLLAPLARRQELAWNAGCGGVHLSLVLAERFERVIATAASGLPDGAVDRVVAAQAAHWFDLPRCSTEARRVARPGALVAQVGYNLPRADAVTDGRWIASIRRSPRPPLAPERRHADFRVPGCEFRVRGSTRKVELLPPSVVLSAS